MAWLHYTVADALRISQSDIPFCYFAHNLGVMFDSGLTMKQQVDRICQTACFEIRRIGSIHQFLTTVATKILVTSLVLSRLDYWNSLWGQCAVVFMDRTQHTTRNRRQSLIRSRSLLLEYLPQCKQRNSKDKQINTVTPPPPPPKKKKKSTIKSCSNTPMFDDVKWTKFIMSATGASDFTVIKQYTNACACRQLIIFYFSVSNCASDIVSPSPSPPPFFFQISLTVYHDLNKADTIQLGGKIRKLGYNCKSYLGHGKLCTASRIAVYMVMILPHTRLQLT